MAEVSNCIRCCDRIIITYFDSRSVQGDSCDMVAFHEAFNVDLISNFRLSIVSLVVLALSLASVRISLVLRCNRQICLCNHERTIINGKICRELHMEVANIESAFLSRFRQYQVEVIRNKVSIVCSTIYSACCLRCLGATIENIKVRSSKITVDYRDGSSESGNTLCFSIIRLSVSCSVDRYLYSNRCDLLITVLFDHELYFAEVRISVGELSFIQAHVCYAGVVLSNPYIRPRSTGCSAECEVICCVESAIFIANLYRNNIISSSGMLSAVILIRALMSLYCYNNLILEWVYRKFALLNGYHIVRNICRAVCDSHFRSLRCAERTIVICSRVDTACRCVMEIECAY